MHRSIGWSGATLQKKKEMKGKGVSPLRRLAAYAVDWYLATMVCGAPLLLVNSMRTGIAALDTSLPPDGAGWLWGAVAILLGVLYYWLVPLLWNGQTPGKRLLRLQIVRADNGESASAGKLFMRQVAGLLLLEGAVAFPSQLLRELLARAAGEGAADAVCIGMVAITIVSVMLGVYTPGRRMLHDRISGTCEVLLPETSAVHSEKSNNKA